MMKITQRRKTQVREFLSTDVEVRQIVARMARSEVKNYLAEVAEQAEVPFDNPVSFLRNIWGLPLGQEPDDQARDRASAEFAAKCRAAQDGVIIPGVGTGAPPWPSVPAIPHVPGEADA